MQGDDAVEYEYEREPLRRRGRSAVMDFWSRQDGTGAGLGERSVRLSPDTVRPSLSSRGGCTNEQQPARNNSLYRSRPLDNPKSGIKGWEIGKKEENDHGSESKKSPPTCSRTRRFTGAGEAESPSGRCRGRWACGCARNGAARSKEQLQHTSRSRRP
jgi:hypothetical protein